ncbi:MAG: trehalose-binding protein [Proteobacteria bacterium]|nr:trehalose-binding protein [Pseudomonadota bacterium]
MNTDYSQLLAPSDTIGPYSIDQFIEAATRFHGYAAPGLVLGGFMVDAAIKALPDDTLFDAISETSWCLPDAVQMLSPCSIGNGWLKILNLGLYAVCLYDKFTGKGVRLWLDLDKVEPDSEIKTWLLKLKPKPEQDSKLLRRQIIEAGASLCSMRDVQIRPEQLIKRSKGRVVPCPICKEPYPAQFGAICRSCQGESPYVDSPNAEFLAEPDLVATLVQKAIGGSPLHDMTRIEPGVSKGPEFLHGQVITGGDVCRLQRMGRSRIYLDDQNPGTEWVHENKVATAFAKLMSGPGTRVLGDPREGKSKLVAAHDGLLVVDSARLKQFNHVPGVMCACRQSHSIVQKSAQIAGTRAIPLYLPNRDFQAALQILDEEPLFAVHPLRKARVGVLVTGTEVFTGLVEDKFAPVVSAKVAHLGSQVVSTIKAPDDARAICNAVQKLVAEQCDLIITTAGLSVDPDDVTRKGLQDAGITEMLYGMPVLPGAMTLLGHLGSVQILGVPACALFHKTTSLDLLLPRLLADIPITRSNLAEFGEGGLCHECKTCTFPKCSFGR